VGQVSLESRLDQPSFDDRNAEQLAELWTARNSKEMKFSIQSGDVLHVSVPRLDELHERKVRVDEQGNFSLPLLGDFHAAGLSEEELRQELMRRASEYMYHPQVDLFVTSVRGRQAGVLGEVRNPGMYTLNGSADTIRKMIQRAGGIGEKGKQEVLFTTAPSEAVQPASPDRASVLNVSVVPSQVSAAAGNVPGSGQLSSSASRKDEFTPMTTTPLVVDLRPGSPDERYLDLPVFPGDTLVVPRACEVTVMGWVYSPKVMPIVPGFTVLGAVSAAGGPLYAADMSSVELIRQEGHGRVTVETVDLEKVKKHEALDLSVQANDVVHVPYSAVRIPGYAAYYIAQGVFSLAPSAMLVSGAR
jgi:polysaccharide export outer membrane protein